MLHETNLTICFPHLFLQMFTPEASIASHFTQMVTWLTTPGEVVLKRAQAHRIEGLH